MAESAPKAAQARAVVGAGHVRIADAPAVVGKPRPATLEPEAQVELIRDGSLVRAIEVVCKCGERIRVRLDYE